MNGMKVSGLRYFFPKRIGKTQRVFHTLEQFEDYAFVKDGTIKAYEITPEAYWQKFRNMILFLFTNLCRICHREI